VLAASSSAAAAAAAATGASGAGAHNGRSSSSNGRNGRKGQSGGPKALSRGLGMGLGRGKENNMNWNPDSFGNRVHHGAHRGGSTGPGKVGSSANARANNTGAAHLPAETAEEEDTEEVTRRNERVSSSAGLHAGFPDDSGLLASVATSSVLSSQSQPVGHSQQHHYQQQQQQQQHQYSYSGKQSDPRTSVRSSGCHNPHNPTPHSQRQRPSSASTGRSLSKRSIQPRAQRQPQQPQPQPQQQQQQQLQQQQCHASWQQEASEVAGLRALQNLSRLSKPRSSSSNNHSNSSSRGKSAGANFPSNRRQNGTSLEPTSTVAAWDMVAQFEQFSERSAQQVQQAQFPTETPWVAPGTAGGAVDVSWDGQLPWAPNATSGTVMASPVPAHMPKGSLQTSEDRIGSFLREAFL
jgi:hypothetical protein